MTQPINNCQTETMDRVQIPLPFALKWVNAYLIPGDAGYTLIDPGLHTEEAERVWKEELGRRGIGFADIEQIVLTHYHPDHYGLAGWFQEQGGGRAPVRMSPIGYAHAKMMWADDQTMSTDLPDLYIRHGMEPSLLKQIRPHMDSFVELVSPQPEVGMIHPGESIRLGNRVYTVIETAGHAAGHLCFYDGQARIMICGDQVLPHITPNVSFLPGSDPNPLDSFLTSLKQLQDYEVEIAYPGHRYPFDNWTVRIDQILRHHDERLAQMTALLEQPKTAYEVCVSLFGTRLTIHQLRFAMSETLAHLIYLTRSGQVRELEDQVVRYSRSR